MHEDDRWLAGLKRRDAAAYETLVDRFEGPLYRYFLASHGDPQLAGEQSADCFGELVDALPKMTGGTEQLRPFVFAVARNVLRRCWRSDAARPLSLEVVSDVVDSKPSAESAMEVREDLSRFFEALRELDQTTREIFILRYIEQLPLSEVAATVGEPLGTVKSRVHRGRRKLEELLRTAEK